MKVLLLGEVENGGIGGGESVIVGLVRGLAAISDGRDIFTVLCGRSLADQLRPFEGPSIQIITRPKPQPTTRGRLRAMFGPLRKPLGRWWRALRGTQPQGLPRTLPQADAFLRSIDCDVTHFLVPLHFCAGTTRPVFTIHDLQHEHLPEIFGLEQIRYRRMLYEGVREECRAVIAISSFTADDFQKHHPVPARHLYRIPWAPYVDETPAAASASADIPASLPPRFILYPAYSYAHKNHRRLLEALSLLAGRGMQVPLVCTGGRSDEWTRILDHHRTLHPVPALHHLGYVAPGLLKALYERAVMVVFPTLFEGAGLPLIEAGRLGKAVACSDIPPFREFAASAPAYFDPLSPAAMADAIAALWTSEEQRQSAGHALRQQTHTLNWADTAAAHLAVYRHVAQQSLTESDTAWLQRTVLKNHE